MKTQIALARRQTTLQTLRSSGALFLWHPLLVDAALDLQTGFERLEPLVQAPSFTQAVEQISCRAPSLAEALGDEMTRCLLNTSRSLAEPFLRAMRRKTLARMKLTVHTNRLLSDEIDEQLHFEFLRMADRFIPGAVGPDGIVRTFGFKAFLEMQLPYKLRDIARRCMADFSRNDYPDDLDQRLVALSHPAPSSDMASAVRRAIRDAVRSPREARLLEAFIRENGELAEFTAVEVCSAGKVRRDLEGIFSRAAASLQTEGRPVNTPRLLYCRQALQDLVPAGELSSWLNYTGAFHPHTRGESNLSLASIN